MSPIFTSNLSQRHGPGALGVRYLEATSPVFIIFPHAVPKALHAILCAVHTLELVLILLIRVQIESFDQEEVSKMPPKVRVEDLS